MIISVKLGAYRPKSEGWSPSRFRFIVPSHSESHLGLGQAFETWADWPVTITVVVTRNQSDHCKKVWTLAAMFDSNLNHHAKDHFWSGIIQSRIQFHLWLSSQDRPLMKSLSRRSNSRSQRFNDVTAFTLSLRSAFTPYSIVSVSESVNDHFAKICNDLWTIPSIMRISVLWMKIFCFQKSEFRSFLTQKVYQPRPFVDHFLPPSNRSISPFQFPFRTLHVHRSSFWSFTFRSFSYSLFNFAILITWLFVNQSISYLSIIERLRKSPQFWSSIVIISLNLSLSNHRNWVTVWLSSLSFHNFLIVVGVLFN
jgi:hypothetical protein